MMVAFHLRANPAAAEFRRKCRQNEFTGPTCGQAPGSVQANLVVLPKSCAFDFLLFCQRNPRPCPILDVTEPGDPVPRWIATDADLRTDLPKYRIYREGKLDAEVLDLSAVWREDFVAFLLGCSFTFEQALLDAGIPVRHLEERSANQPKNVPMYRTSTPCRPAGPFAGPLVVSMRPMPPRDAIRAVSITARTPLSHGAPVHIGDPRAIGIADLEKPDWGDPVTIRDGETPVFWACGVTPQAVILETKLPLAITHAPGHMFVSDLRDVDLETL